VEEKDEERSSLERLRPCAQARELGHQGWGVLPSFPSREGLVLRGEITLSAHRAPLLGAQGAPFREPAPPSPGTDLYRPSFPARQ
jgi:hypothetical protein